MSRKRIAVVATIYSYLSHAQHFADRFMVGYPYGGKWHPRYGCCISVCRSKPERPKRRPRPRIWLRCLSNHRRSIALRHRQDDIVDAMLIIGEHGEYPNNEKAKALSALRVL